MLSDGSVSDFIALGPLDHLFKGENEKALFAYVKMHFSKYAKLPSVDTVETQTKLDLTGGDENWEFYHDFLKKRHVEKTLKAAMTEASEYLQGDSLNTEAALKAMTEGVMTLIREHTALEIVDFRHAYEAIIGEYAASYQEGSDFGFKFGWPTIDDMTGGVTKGDLVSVVGRPMKGKTWFMLHMAVHQWLETGKAKLADPKLELTCEHSRLFVSLEMPIAQIQQRLAAMIAKIPASMLKHHELTSLNMKKLKLGLLEIRGFGAPFWVVDGNFASTVEDIWIKARQLKPDAILIDGGYMMKHPTERDRYRRVAENAELIKKDLCSLAPTIVSWQFAKIKKTGKGVKEAPGIDDIGYTDAIAQVTSLGLGLLDPESVETIKSRRVSVWKGRHGEQGGVNVNFDPDKMEFGEVEEESISELQVE